MKNRTRRICIFFAAFVALILLAVFRPFNRFSSATVRAVRNDPTLVLYSLNPYRSEAGTSGKEIFRGYAILGQTTINEPKDREIVVGELKRATRGGWALAMCFDPRHGIRATDRTGVYDLLLCYQCNKAYVFSPDGHRTIVPILGPSTTLNAILTAAHVPLPEQ